MDKDINRIDIAEFREGYLHEPRRRLRECVERWPDAHEGGYDPRCCRFPKSCSADVYDDDAVNEGDLEGGA